MWIMETFGPRRQAAVALLAVAVFLVAMASYVAYPFLRTRDFAGNETNCLRATLGKGTSLTSVCVRPPLASEAASAQTTPPTPR